MINKDPMVRQAILSFLEQQNFVESFSIVGPGFLNIFVKKSTLFVIENINFGEGEKIHVEYFSPNPTGDLHLGHCRNIIIGFCLCNLLKICGFEVTSESYVNDQGNQMNQFLETIQFWQKKIRNQSTENLQIFYKGAYVEEIAQELGHQDANRENVVQIIMKKIDKSLSKMGVKHDFVVFESDLYEHMQKTQTILEEKKLLYRGKLDNQKTDGLHLILQTSSLGLETDTVFQRENGSFTYFAFDLAYHLYKKERGFSAQICVLGEDHAGHIEKLSCVLKKALSINLRILKYHMVFLSTEEELVHMSKREGNIVSLDQVLEKIDIDFLKWVILSHSITKVIKLNLQQVSVENPLFNLLYVFMRLKQIEACAKTENRNIDDIFKRCFFWPIELRTSVDNLDSHKILMYTFDLCLSLKKFLDSVTANKVSERDFYILEKAKFIVQKTTEIMSLHGV